MKVSHVLAGFLAFALLIALGMPSYYGPPTYNKGGYPSYRPAPSYNGRYYSYTPTPSATPNPGKFIEELMTSYESSAEEDVQYISEVQLAIGESSQAAEELVRDIETRAREGEGNPEGVAFALADVLSGSDPANGDLPAVSDLRERLADITSENSAAAANVLASIAATDSTEDALGGVRQLLIPGIGDSSLREFPRLPERDPRPEPSVYETQEEQIQGPWNGGGGSEM